MNKPGSARRRPVSPRRTFSVKSQLVGKLGEEGYDLLRERLDGLAVERKPRRRRSRRKVVTVR